MNPVSGERTETPGASERLGGDTSRDFSGLQADTLPDNSSVKASIIIGLLILAALTLILIPVLKDRKTQEAEAGSTQAPLPQQNAIVENEAQTGSDIPSGRSETNNPIADIEGPWSESKRIAARRDAQDILAELLSAQSELETLRAAEWAAMSLSEAEGKAQAGDTAYQGGRFEEAIALYGEALSESKAIIAGTEDQAEAFLAEGINALEENNIVSAISKLELATILDNRSEQSKQALSRARAREQILDLDLQAKQQLAVDKLENARDLYVEIRQLDPYYEDIESTIAELEAKILDRDFRATMSRGFAMLSANQLDKAESAFKEANTLQPNSDAVAQALQQVEASRINTDRQNAIDRAVSLEATERWQEAAGIYNNILLEDSTLTAAQLGKIRSEARAKLNSAIEEIISEPLMLQADSAWDSANTTLSEAKNIISRGPKLTEQITLLESIVKRARTKIRVELASDSATDVEIYRVGNLGSFKEQAVALYPGNYVIVGKRVGYRDVRHDLVLDGMSDTVSLSVQCMEQI